MVLLSDDPWCHVISYSDTNKVANKQKLDGLKSIQKKAKEQEHFMFLRCNRGIKNVLFFIYIYIIFIDLL